MHFSRPAVTAEIEVTKRSIRVQTWKKMQDEKLLRFRGSSFNRIPFYNDSDKAAAQLAETDEYKKASKCDNIFLIDAQIFKLFIAHRNIKD